jgi:putative ABC transport system permease protein
MRRSLYLLNLRQLFSLRLRTIIAVVAVAAGSSLGLSVVIVSSSVSASLNRFDHQVAGVAPIRISGAVSPGGIDFPALAAVAHTPGVMSLLPVVQAISVVRERHGVNQNVAVIGVDCAAQGGNAFCASSSVPPNVVIVPSALQKQLNASSWLETDLGLVRLTGATSDAQLNNLNHGDVIVMSLSAAQRDFDRQGEVDDIYVTPQPGVSVATLEARLSKAVGGWDGVSSSAAIPPEVQLLINDFVPLLSLLAILASGIAIVLVYNVVTLSLEERRRNQAIASVVGAPPSVLIIGPLIEAGVLGALGGVLGALGGTVLARPIVGSLSTSTLQLVGVPLNVHTSASTYGIGLGLGVVLSVIAAIRPVRRALRQDPAAELSNRSQREETSTTHSVRNGVVLSVLGLGALALSWLGERNGSLASWQPTAAVVGFAAVTLCLVLALGAWAPVLLTLAARSRRLRSGILRLGVSNLIRAPARTGVMAVAVGAAVGIAFVTASYTHAVDLDVAGALQHSSLAHGVVVTTLSGKNGANTDARIPAPAVAALSTLPGVTKVQQFEDLVAGHSANQLVLVEGTPNISANVAVYEGRAALGPFERGEVMIGAGLARRTHVHPGGRLTLDTPAGFVLLRVEGVWDDGNAGGNNVTMDPAVLRRLYGDQLPDALNLEVARDVAPGAVVREAQARHLAPFLVYSTPAKQLSNQTTVISGQITPFWVLQRALLLMSFVTVLSTLLLVGVQRRREFGLLAAVGMSPGELFGLVTAEALAVGVVGSVLGIAMGFVMLSALLDVVPLFVGFHDRYSPDLLSLLVYWPLTLVVALAASLWPGWRASQLPILEALQYE